MEYLEFELPIKELEETYQQTLAIGSESDVDVTKTINLNALRYPSGFDIPKLRY